jgi:hypothetical protein
MQSGLETELLMTLVQQPRELLQVRRQLNNLVLALSRLLLIQVYLQKPIITGLDGQQMMMVQGQP